MEMWRDRGRLSLSMADEIMEGKDLPKRYRHFDLADWPDMSSRFAPEECYYIHGPLGTGKTALLCAMVKERLLARNGIHDMIFTTADDLMESMKFGFKKPDTRSLDGDGEEESRIDSTIWRYRSVRLLAIDDLGAEIVTDWRLGTLTSIINYRYNEMMVTYITSNYDLKDLGEKFSMRISDRLKQMCSAIHLIGPSRRE